MSKTTETTSTNHWDKTGNNNAGDKAGDNPGGKKTPRIAIIGAGVSGIAAVVKLERAGYTDVTVFEKSDRVGGTWRDNTYPGLSCDIPSRWYSFSFALKADWTHRYSYGADIQAYLERVAQDFGVVKKVRFNTGVTDLRYEKPLWHLTTQHGLAEQYDIVISATGILHNPMVPDIAGLKDFAGKAFHSARWDHDTTLEGKRVGVIGTGSTASQIVGAIAKVVPELKVFQRTPQWMAPLPQKKYSPHWNAFLARFPFLQRWAYHFYFQGLLRTFGSATVGNKQMQGAIARMCKKHLRDNVPDPELRAKLTPHYKAACKRLVICSEFYPAISRPNAHLITESIEQIESTGVRTADGALHELDVLVLATGFDPTAFILPTKVTGENGVDLETFWDGSPRAHRALGVPGFPNFWMIEGPTGPVGNLSLITVSEQQVDYVISMLDQMKASGATSVSPKLSAFAQYNDDMANAIQDTIWVTGGCDSWYFDKSGTPNLYPWNPARYLKDLRQPNFNEYTFS